MRTQDLFDGARFGFIIERCRAAVGVDIANLLRRHLGFLQGETHRLGCWFTSRMRCRHVVRIIGESIAADFTKDSCSTTHGVL